MTIAKHRRALFLQEMGVGPVWTVRARGDAAVPAISDALPGAVAADQAVQPVIAGAVEKTPKPVAAGAVDAAWQDVPSARAPVPLQHASSAPSAAEIAQMDWRQLQAAVAACTKCRLCETRTHTVFGAGSKSARWLFVGEGPGHSEDVQGEPFIGPAGKLLDNMLAAMGLQRGVQAYIANIVKCRPTDAGGHDRPPQPDEAAACLPYLARQIELIQPAIIVALGKTAALSLLDLDAATPLAQLRGSVHRHAGRPLIVTYHPAYLLRKPEDKGQAWRDLCLAMTTYAGTNPPG